MSEEYDFSDIPEDLYLENIWKNLPVKNIVSLCRTNRFMMKICENNDTWRYLIRRDFNKNFNHNNARAKYVELNNEKWRKIIQTEFKTTYLGDNPVLEYKFLVNNEKWRRLLLKDFGIQYTGKNAEQEYKLVKNKKWTDLLKKDFGKIYVGKEAEQQYYLFKTYNDLFNKMEFDANKPVNMYNTKYIRNIAMLLKIPTRSSLSKDQLYELLVNMSNYTLENLDPQLF